MAEALKPIVFRVGNELYGIDIQYVNAIEKDQDIVRVPNASSSIKWITSSCNSHESGTLLKCLRS